MKIHHLLGVLLIVAVSSTSNSLFAQSFDLEKSINQGKKYYSTFCASCHMSNGQGLQGLYPPLTIPEMMENKSRLVKSILNGVEAPKEVNGVTYPIEMVKLDLEDEQVAHILNYIRNSWGNEFTDPVLPKQVQSLLKEADKN